MSEISRIKTCSGLSFLNDACAVRRPNRAKDVIHNQQEAFIPVVTDLRPLDQAINQALPYSTSLESTLNRGDTVEIQGPSGSGKTELLYFLATKTLLPREIFLHSFRGPQGPQSLVLGGRNKSVVVCDCDGRWNVTRLMTIILQIMREKFVKTFPDADPVIAGLLEELNTVALDALQHLHIFQPTSSASLAATLIRMPQYHFAQMPHEEICMLMVDGGLSSFYWQDRWSAEVMGRRINEGIQVSPATEVVRALVSFIKSHKPITFITTRALFPLSKTSYFFKQHLPPPFPAPFETSPDGKTIARTSALDITHHITLCNPNQSPVSDHEELPAEDEENPESHINIEFLRVQGVMRTPPRDVPESIVNHFSFILTDSGITAEAIEAMEGLSPIDPSAPEY